MTRIEAGVVGVVLERLLERCEAVEQAAHLVVDEALVAEAREGRELVGPGLGAERRHRHALFPGEHPRRAPQVGDLGQPLLQVAQRRIHFGPDHSLIDSYRAALCPTC